MIHLEPTQRMFISEDLVGYADTLATEGTVPRRVDLLLFGFSYAVANNLYPAENFDRHDLIAVTSIDATHLLAIEAVANWYAEQLLADIKDHRDLLGFICAVGIAGVNELRQRWELKRKSQIQWDILQLISSDDLDLRKE